MLSAAVGGVACYGLGTGIVAGLLSKLGQHPQRVVVAAISGLDRQGLAVTVPAGRSTT